ncbi:DUF732 domain-containing protein [Arthrobacter woluwensis]|uniref:DUF732 domain-containing protein n=1 Tax=Arthrobacter woluwensis TaxID=156980 RepID=UPI00381E5BB2
MNKKLFAAAPLLLVLVGCSAPAVESAPTVTVAGPTVTVAAESPSPAVTAKARAEQIDDIYLSTLRKEQPALKAADGADLISIGKGFCDFYDHGATGSDINSYILKAAGWGYTVPQLVAVHGAAVGAYCPKYISKMGS